LPALSTRARTHARVLREVCPRCPYEHELTREVHEQRVRSLQMNTNSRASPSRGSCVFLRGSRAPARVLREARARPPREHDTESLAHSPLASRSAVQRRPPTRISRAQRTPSPAGVATRLRTGAALCSGSHSRRTFRLKFNRAGQDPVRSEYRQDASLQARPEPFLTTHRPIKPAQNALRTIYYYTKKIPNHCSGFPHASKKSSAQSCVVNLFDQ
jgi:hypothetical protein